MTSYDYDEFGESVRLDRGMLHPALAALPLLMEPGPSLTDKRSCSLPNLLAESPARPVTFPGPDEGNVTLLSGWLQAQDEKPKCVPREITSISEEKPYEDTEKDSCDYGEKKDSYASYLQGDEVAEESSTLTNYTNGVKSSRNGDATSPNFHCNGHVNKTAAHAEVHIYRDAPLSPEHRQNGHLLGKAGLKSTETEVESGCGLQNVYNTNCSCGDDREFCAQGTSRGVCTGKTPLLKNQPCCQRTSSNLRRSSSGEDEVFDS